MPISINWGTRVIFVPQSDLTLVSGLLYELDLNTLRLALKDLEDSEDGVVFPITHNHNTEVVVGGLTLARVIEIINGYTVTFEDGQYAVRLVGANSNVGDVVNVNQVSVRTQNAAGLITTTVGSGLSAEQDTRLAELHRIHGLELGSPMTVSATSRAVGAVAQTIQQIGGDVIVTRT